MGGGGQKKIGGRSPLPPPPLATRLGPREVYLCEFEWGTGAREVDSGVDKTKKVEPKKKVCSTKISTNSYRRLKILAIFREFLSED